MVESSQVLEQLVDNLLKGKIRIVDLTQTLQPSTPIIPLPPEFENTWPFQLEEISK
jgi:hypothetical protein